jgi:hypothetical protein
VHISIAPHGCALGDGFCYLRSCDDVSIDLIQQVALLSKRSCSVELVCKTSYTTSLGVESERSREPQYLKLNVASK